MSTPNTAILILHHKKPKLTINCLESLKQQTNNDFHIFLLIQGASDEDKITLKNLYENWNQITILQLNENKGFAEGNNILLRQAIKQDFKYFVTLNNDTKVTDDFIQNIIKPFNNKNIGLVQARMMQMNDIKKIDSLGIEFLKSGIAFNIKSEQKIMFCPSAGAACYSRELLDATKLEKQQAMGFESRIIYDYFDSRYFAYAEDLDLGFRALHAGFMPALANDAICYHLGSATTNKMSDLAIFYTYRNIIWTIYKNFPRSWLVKYSWSLILGQILLLINFIKKRKFIVFVSAIKYALKDIKKFKLLRQEIQNNSKISNKNLERFLTKKIIDKDYL